MHIILTGATGLVGSAALDALLFSKEVTKVTILSRKPVPQAESHAKVKVIDYQDFSTYPEFNKNLSEAIKDASGCIWALGISQNAVSKKDYIAITRDFPNAFVKYLSSIVSTPCSFVLVSGEGATQKPGAFTPLFGKVKGQAETDLLNFSEKNSNISVYVARPAAVDPGQHKELLALGKTSATPMLAKVLFPAMYTIYPSMMSPTRELGQALVKLAMMKGEAVQGPGVEQNGRIVNNVGLRSMVGL
jgi:nucleoside-diphosphate-sugar epimerase